MTPEEVKDVVHQVLSEQRAKNAEELDTVALRTIATILTSFGMDEDDRKELRADFQHLRKWRKSTEQAQAFGMKAMITVIVTGLLGAIWMGIKVALGK